jgi:hypothetical protein
MSSLLNSCMGVLVCGKDKSVSFWLKLLIQYPLVNSMQPWVIVIIIIIIIH